MGLSKFDIYTYQFVTLPFKQLSLFEKNLTKEELFEKKNIFFREIFNSELSFFHRRYKLNFKLEYTSDDFILVRLANKKIVHIEKEFHRESFESEPSCLIAIHNSPKIQRIAVESDKTSFGSSFTVVRVIENAFERALHNFNLKLNVHPQYEEKEFWDLLEKYNMQIEGLKFEFEYPNLPRVNKYLSDELRNASKTLNSEKTKVEFIATGDKVLENLEPENEELSSLVKTSAEGAGPVKLKIKGLRRWESTDNKVKSFEFDELEIDAAQDRINEYISNLKDLLSNE